MFLFWVLLAFVAFAFIGALLAIFNVVAKIFARVILTILAIIFFAIIVTGIFVLLI